KAAVSSGVASRLLSSFVIVGEVACADRDRPWVLQGPRRMPVDELPPASPPVGLCPRVDGAVGLGRAAARCAQAGRGIGASRDRTHARNRSGARGAGVALRAQGLRAGALAARA